MFLRNSYSIPKKILMRFIILLIRIHHEHREALIGMRSALDTWIVETNDQGEFPEDEAIVKPFEKEMHDWFGTPPWHPYKPEENP